MGRGFVLSEMCDLYTCLLFGIKAHSLGHLPQFRLVLVGLEPIRAPLRGMESDNLTPLLYLQVTSMCARGDGHVFKALHRA